MRRLLIVTGAAVVLVIALIVVQQVTKSDSNTPDPSNLTGLAEVQAEFDGLPERAGTIGPAGAKVTITEFGDLRCPICKTFDNEVVPTLVENFVRTGKAKMEFKVWPILGPNSVDAAKAAYAAKQQNALWRYAALTYLNQGDENVNWFTPAFARSVAQALGLDLAKFDKDRASAAAVTAIDQVNQEATDLGFQGTPTIRVSGPNGTVTVDATLEAITAAVQKASGSAG
jgi:protein-disulfide isomerase